MDFKRNRFGEIEEWSQGMPLEKGDDIWYESGCHIVYKKKGEKKKMMYIRNKHGEVELITLVREFQPGDEIVTEMNDPEESGKTYSGNYLVKDGKAGLGTHGDIAEDREGKSGIGKALGGGDPKGLSVKLSHDAKETGWKIRGLTKKYNRCVVCGKDLNLALGEFRKSNSKYCSNKCVNRAKYLRRAKTLKAQRDAKKGAK